MFSLICCYLVLLYCGTVHTAILKSQTTTESLIKDYGYPFEAYEVVTDDEYVVSLFRIPYSPKNENSSTVDHSEKPAVLMVHGFGQASSDWVLSGSPRSLGFLLADEGYDVWLANVRGTRYSQKHLRYSILDPAFWRFSWHEMGIYDLPAFTKYILEKTSNRKIRYIGHSQGTTSFFVAASTVEGFNEYIEGAYLFAPVAFMSNATSPILPVLALPFGQPDNLGLTNIGDFEILPNKRLNEIISNIVCTENSPVKVLCLDFADFIYGWRSKQTNTTALRILFDAIPAGASVKQLFHYLQLYNSRKFQQFDYGILNFEYYNQDTPPNYHLENVTAPVFLYYSQNDALSDPKDVQILVNALPINSLEKYYKIPIKDWNHIDFIIGNNVDEILYRMVLDDMKRT